MKPSLADVRTAIKVARKGARRYKGAGLIKFDQREWCGTSCCVWGHSLLVAGQIKTWISIVKSTLTRDKWAKQSFRHLAITEMMCYPYKVVLPIIDKLANPETNPVHYLQQLRAKDDSPLSERAGQILDEYNN